jgi:hypothetical protein
MGLLAEPSALRMDPARIIDGIVALTVLEGLVLWLFHRRTGRGLAPRHFALALASGLCLMLALRAAVVGSATGWVFVALTAAGVIHAADIWWRWPRR